MGDDRWIGVPEDPTMGRRLEERLGCGEGHRVGLKSREAGGRLKGKQQAELGDSMLGRAEGLD